MEVRQLPKELDFANDLALISQADLSQQTGTICKNDRPQNQHSKDHDDELEQPRRQKGPGRWRRAKNGETVTQEGGSNKTS